MVIAWNALDSKMQLTDVLKTSYKHLHKLSWEKEVLSWYY